MRISDWSSDVCSSDLSRYVDSVTHKVVDDDEQVKGYETGEGEYVMLEEDEIASVALESTRTIDIEQFVPRDSIEWLWYDKPHYLVPDDPDRKSTRLNSSH